MPLQPGERTRMSTGNRNRVSFPDPVTPLPASVTAVQPLSSSFPLPADALDWWFLLSPNFHAFMPSIDFLLGGSSRVCLLQSSSP